MYVCWCIGVLVCVCIEVWPSHTTSAGPISAARAAVEAPIHGIHQPLPASKTVLSSWSLLLICPLIDTSDTGITGCYDNNRGTIGTTGTEALYTIYIYENIGHVQLPEHHLFATYWYHVCVKIHFFHTWYQVLLLLYGAPGTWECTYIYQVHAYV